MISHYYSNGTALPLSCSAPDLALQKHYRHLEAIALEHEEAEPVADLTEPNISRISKRAGNLLDEFKGLVYPADYNPEQKGGTKRKVQLS